MLKVTYVGADSIRPHTSRTLIIDNYDSFTFNLYQLIGQISKEIEVVRNDKITLDEIAKMRPDYIIISPGPGKPRDAGICEALIKRFAGEIPILGICLGHQAICEAFGGEITYAEKLMHGKQSEIFTTSDPIFGGVPQGFKAARYHSLAAKNVPPPLEIIAKTQSGEIMAVKHKAAPLYGLQFHPESILTPEGQKILKNFFMIGEQK
jgi:anthranilate synthase component 2